MVGVVVVEMAYRLTRIYTIDKKKQKNDNIIYYQISIKSYKILWHWRVLWHWRDKTSKPVALETFADFFIVCINFYSIFI